MYMHAPTVCIRLHNTYQGNQMVEFEDAQGPIHHLLLHEVVILQHYLSALEKALVIFPLFGGQQL